MPTITSVVATGRRMKSPDIFMIHLAARFSSLLHRRRHRAPPAFLFIRLGFFIPFSRIFYRAIHCLIALDRFHCRDRFCFFALSVSFASAAAAPAFAFGHAVLGRFLDFHARFGTEQKLALLYHLFAGRKPFGDDHFAVACLANRHRPNFNPFVCFNDKNLLAVRTDLNRFGGNDNGIRLGRQGEHNIDKLAGPQAPLGVGKHGFELDRTGGAVDRVIDKFQVALLRPPFVRWKRGIDLQRAARHMTFELG